MAFEIAVLHSELPTDLGSSWEQGFARLGFAVQVCPGFLPSAWKGGFLPFRVTAAPKELIGLELPDAAVSGFQVFFAPGRATFVSGNGRPSTEFAMQCLAAALLAEATGGTYEDPQSGNRFVGAEAIDAAVAEVRAFVRSARPKELVHHSFPGWEKLRR